MVIDLAVGWRQPRCNLGIHSLDASVWAQQVGEEELVQALALWVCEEADSPPIQGHANLRPDLSRGGHRYFAELAYACVLATEIQPRTTRARAGGTKDDSARVWNPSVREGRECLPK